MDRRQFQRRALALAVSLGIPRAGHLLAQGPEPIDPAESAEPRGVASRTLGGRQFWADEYFFHQWRIQRNVVTGHCRLLDPENVRHAAGTYMRCRARLDEIRERDRLPAMKGAGVVVLHGLGRTRGAMEGLCEHLRRHGSFQTFNLGYPTLHGSVGEHARQLAKVIDSLDGIAPLHFVGHSLGNLVVRRWLYEVTQSEAPQPMVSRLGRMVMLAPPNHRPELAERVARLTLAAQIGGEAFRQLAEDWDDLEPRLAVPPMPFGILSGGRGNDTGFNPLVPGDDDLIVSVQSTRLAGAADFRVFPVTHTFIMDHPPVQRCCLQFLKYGYFESEAARRPIETTD